MRQPLNKPGLLTLTIKDKSALYLAYMPFVKNGGLFIPTNSNYRLGDEVFMLLNLMGEDEKLPVAGRVIWMTPKGAQGKRTAGIGVQFSEQDRGQTQKKIETFLLTPGPAPGAKPAQPKGGPPGAGASATVEDVAVPDAPPAPPPPKGKAEPKKPEPKKPEPPKPLNPKDVKLDSPEFKARVREAVHAMMCLPEYQLN